MPDPTYFLSPSACYISAANSSTTNLGAGNSYTFTGTGEQTAHPDVMVTLFANQVCTLSLQFSHDGTNWDSTITKTSAASVTEFTTLVKGNRYFRISVTSTDATTTTFRLQTQFGQFRQGNLSLNTAIGLDSDAMVVRPTDRGLEVSRGLISSHTSVNKFGRNPTINAGETEDVWGTGGTWVQATAATTVAFVSSSVADASAGTGARTLTIEGLDGSYAQVSETLTLNGTTPVNTALSYFIIHRILVATAGTGGTNAGTITTTWTGGGTPVGPSVAIGKAQTQFAVYQIPAGFTGYVEQYGGGTSGGTTCEVELFVKPFGGVFNLKHTLGLNAAGTSNAQYDYQFPLKVLEKGIVKMVAKATSNATAVNGYFDLVLVANT